jgi:hypothetical protein
MTLLPFQSGFRARGAVPAGILLDGALASLALFDNFMAQAAIIGAAFGGHKRAITTFTNRITNHG